MKDYKTNKGIMLSKIIGDKCEYFDVNAQWAEDFYKEKWNIAENFRDFIDNIYQPETHGVIMYSEALRTGNILYFEDEEEEL